MTDLFCSFCRRGADEVAKLVAGPGVHICDACTQLSLDAMAGKPGAGFAGWDSLSDDPLLKTLPRSAAAVDAARSVLQAQIDVLRGRGRSWADIGGALGVSRQAAWERFG